MSVRNAHDSEVMMRMIVHGLQEKKGKDLISIDLRKVGSSFADFFVICHGGSNRQIDALADSVEEIMSKSLKEKPSHREGENGSDWVLLDYYSVIVNIFSESQRSFYGLEELWGDGEIIEHGE
jgi:ribosome-associated protein